MILQLPINNLLCSTVKNKIWSIIFYVLVTNPSNNNKYKYKKKKKEKKRELTENEKLFEKRFVS